METEIGLNAEGVIIECLRDNPGLCNNAVPRDLLDDFAEIINRSADPSNCDELELFEILCQPSDGGKTIPRNQEMVLDIILADRFTNISNCFESTYGIYGKVSFLKISYVKQTPTKSLLFRSIASQNLNV
jgi:hypothetical protein